MSNAADFSVLEHVYNILNFPYNWYSSIPEARRRRGNPRTRNKYTYTDCLSCFDIETSRIKEIEQSIMYVWQWCFYVSDDNYAICMGRTWDDFLFFRQKIEDLSRGDRQVVYVHNLSYEFQFLRGIHEFDSEDVFCLESRKVLKAVWGKTEFKCSYLQTNMSLDTFTGKMKVKHGKLSGTLDYTKVRYPYTPLSDTEKLYCVNDVLGCCEALAVEMKTDGDNLYTIPLTSTGYVRRDAKKAMRAVGSTYVKDMLPDYDLYVLLREAFRGGNTHANRYYADLKLTSDVYGPIHSADRASAYPSEQCTMRFPVNRFFKVPEEKWNYQEVMNLITVRKRAVIFRAKFTGISLRDPSWGCPYIPVSKCRNLVNYVPDNGRVLEAEYLEITITDVDYNIIAEEYKWDLLQITDIYHARYGQLPECLYNVTIVYYAGKTKLKGVSGSEILYAKMKNKLNSIYGMSAQNPVKPEILFNFEKSDDYTIDKSKTDEQLLAEYNEHAFMPYQWGVWITAWARYHLEEGIRAAGSGFLYTDTDSVKYVGKADFSKINAERRRAAKAAGAYATDPAGKVHYMGVFEQEADMCEFKTLGAKKYVYRDMDGKLHCTIAGVSKKAGAEELESNGGVDALREGFVFTKAGGNELVYNDRPEIRQYTTPDGVTLDITSNVVIRPSTYQVGITADYRRLINGTRFIKIN